MDLNQVTAERDLSIVLLCYSLLYYVSLLCSRNNDQKRVYRIKTMFNFYSVFS